MTKQTDDLFQFIRDRFPNMSEEEIKIEALIQSWIAATENKIKIFVNSDGAYYFMGINSKQLADKFVSPEELYKNVVAGVLVKAIEDGFVYVVDSSGKGDYAFLNSHEINEDDFFLYSLSPDEAIQSILDSVDDSDSM